MQLFSMRGWRGQSAVSYLILTITILAALIPLFYYTLTKTGDVGKAQITESLNTLQTTIHSIGQLGQGGRTEALIHLPKNIQSSLVKDDTISFFTFDGQTYSIRLALPVSGALPTTEGTYSVNFYHNGTHVLIYSCGNDVLEATEQCDTNQVQYCQTPLLGCALPGEIGACNCRCAFPSDCATNNCIIPAGSLTGYCSACIDNSQCPVNHVCSQGVCKPSLPANQPFCQFPSNFVLHPQGNPVTLPNGEALIGPDPFILWDANSNLFKMWRTDWISPVLGISYATSSDGVAWTDFRHILQPTLGTWDGTGLETNVVIQRSSNLYEMIYMGYPGLIKNYQNSQQVFPGPGRRKHLGRATSFDGVNWVKDVSNNPVLAPTLPWEEPWKRYADPKKGEPPGTFIYEGGLEEPALLWDAQAGLYRLWYAASGFMNGQDGKWGYRVGEAESNDLITWTKHAANPIFVPDPEGSWDDTLVSHIAVVPDPSYGYHLFYIGGQRTNLIHVGQAWSADGVTWQRNPNNPLIMTLNPSDPTKIQLPGGPTAVWRYDAARQTYTLYLWIMRTPPGSVNFMGNVQIYLYTADCA